MPKTLKTRNLAYLRDTRWTTATARAVLRAQESSGEQLTAFARRHGLQPQRLFWWRKRFADWGAPEEGAGPELVPVVTSNLALASRSAGSGSAGLHLRSGEVQLEFADATALSPEWLAELVRELGARR